MAAATQCRTAKQLPVGNIMADDTKEKWLEYSERLGQVAIAILGEADKLTVGADVKDPKVLALALLCRTLLNFKGAALMVQSDMVVEARTLTRCCYENLLWIGELAAKKEGFVQEMARDEVSSQQSRGKMILTWGEMLESPMHHESLKERPDFLKGMHPKAKPIKFGDLGKTNGIADSYMWFRHLSSDSAHPSMTSLARHLMREPDGSIMIAVVPDVVQKELNETLQFANQGLLGVCVATCEIVGVPKAHASLSPLFEEFITLATLEKERPT
jgi:hypothetical protein